MRMERRHRHDDPPSEAEELFLGDVHTERALRRLHRPSGYQPPLQSVKVSASPGAPQGTEEGSRAGTPGFAKFDLCHPEVMVQWGVIRVSLIENADGTRFSYTFCRSLR